MKTIKVSEAEGEVLNWLVAKCEGDNTYRPRDYSGDWTFGGPIIERELLRLIAPTVRGVDWVARIKQNLPSNMNDWHEKYGPTPLIAAMRCYVTSKLGEEVEVPDALS